MRPFWSCPVLLALSCLSTGCSDGSSSSGSTYDVKAGDTTCRVEQTTFDAGRLSFDVQNTGSDVTEVYVYGKQGSTFSKIMGEVEDVGPGTSRSLDVNLAAGSYQVACKPGMTGTGIRTFITVRGNGGSTATNPDTDND
jgi:iron uptake system component EfeO